MLFIKQSLSAATTLTALLFNADGQAVAHQITTDTDHTTISGEMRSDSSASLKAPSNHPLLIASQQAFGMVVPTPYLHSHNNNFNSN